MIPLPSHAVDVAAVALAFSGEALSALPTAHWCPHCMPLAGHCQPPLCLPMCCSATLPAAHWCLCCTPPTWGPPRASKSSRKGKRWRARCCRWTQVRWVAVVQLVWTVFHFFRGGRVTCHLQYSLLPAPCAATTAVRMLAAGPRTSDTNPPCPPCSLQEGDAHA